MLQRFVDIKILQNILFCIFGVFIFWVKAEVRSIHLLRQILYTQDDFLVLPNKTQFIYNKIVKWFYLNCNFCKTFFGIFGVYIFWGKFKVIWTGSCEGGKEHLAFVTKRTLPPDSVQYCHTNIQTYKYIQVYKYTNKQIYKYTPSLVFELICVSCSTTL